MGASDRFVLEEREREKKTWVPLWSAQIASRIRLQTSLLNLSLSPSHASSHFFPLSSSREDKGRKTNLLAIIRKMINVSIVGCWQVQQDAQRQLSAIRRAPPGNGREERRNRSNLGRRLVTVWRPLASDCHGCFVPSLPRQKIQRKKKYVIATSAVNNKKKKMESKPERRKATLRTCKEKKERDTSDSPHYIFHRSSGLLEERGAFCHSSLRNRVSLLGKVTLRRTTHILVHLYRRGL